MKHLNKSQYFKMVVKVLIQANQSDLWVAGGFLRNLVWDSVFRVTQKPVINDIDIIFLKNRNTPITESGMEKILCTISPDFKWSVKEQQKMAVKHGHSPYASVEEAIEKWVETATAIAYNPLASGSRLLLPYGASDLLGGIVRPTTERHESLALRRAEEKKWLNRWPDLVFAKPIFS